MRSNADICRDGEAQLRVLHMPDAEFASVAFADSNCKLRHVLLGNESIYLHHGGPLLENGFDSPENSYGSNYFHVYR